MAWVGWRHFWELRPSKYSSPCIMIKSSWKFWVVYVRYRIILEQCEQYNRFFLRWTWSFNRDLFWKIQTRSFNRTGRLIESLEYVGSLGTVYWKHSFDLTVFLRDCHLHIILGSFNSSPIWVSVILNVPSISYEVLKGISYQLIYMRILF